MNTQLLCDEINAQPDPDAAGASLQRLVLDFADLVDWAGDMAPQVRRARAASETTYLVSVGLAALLALGVALLVSRARREDY